MAGTDARATIQRMSAAAMRAARRSGDSFRARGCGGTTVGTGARAMMRTRDPPIPRNSWLGDSSGRDSAGPGPRPGWMSVSATGSGGANSGGWGGAS